MKHLKLFFVQIFLLSLFSQAKFQANPNVSINTNGFQKIQSFLEQVVNSTDFKVFGVNETVVKNNLSQSSQWFSCITPNQWNVMNILYNKCLHNSTLDSSSTQNWQARIPGMSTLICLYSGIINFKRGSSRANENYMKAEIIGKSSLSVVQKRQAEIGIYRCLLTNTNGSVWARLLPAELLEPIAKDSNLMTGVMKEWFTNMMNGRDYVIPTMTKEFKALVVPLKGMMCLFGSLVINGCTAAASTPKTGTNV